MFLEGLEIGLTRLRFFCKRLKAVTAYFNSWPYVRLPPLAFVWKELTINNCSSEELASPQYSGLYAYYIASNTWQLLLADKHDLPAPQPRVSHSMLFHPVIIIFISMHRYERRSKL